jgi:hypothetical protein
MGRANYVILAIGIASALFLSLLMKHLLQFSEERQRSPVVDEIVAVFGSRIDGRPELVIDNTMRGPRAVVTVKPILGAVQQPLAKEVGEYVWHRLGPSKKLFAVDVVCLPWSHGGPMRFAIPSPAAGSPVLPPRRPDAAIAPAGAPPGGAVRASPRIAPSRPEKR